MAEYRHRCVSVGAYTGGEAGKILLAGRMIELHHGSGPP